MECKDTLILKIKNNTECNFSDKHYYQQLTIRN